MANTTKSTNAVTDKQVEQARSKVDRLNEQIAELQAKASADIRSQENAVRVARLDAEAERLQAELEALRRMHSKSVLKETVSETVEEVREGQRTVVPAPGGGTTEEKK